MAPDSVAFFVIKSTLIILIPFCVVYLHFYSYVLCQCVFCNLHCTTISRQESRCLTSKECSHCQGCVCDSWWCTCLAEVSDELLDLRVELDEKGVCYAPRLCTGHRLHRPPLMSRLNWGGDFRRYQFEVPQKLCVIVLFRRLCCPFISNMYVLMR